MKSCTTAKHSGVPAGVGSQLQAYDLPSGRLQQNSTVLPNAARVHGIHAAQLADGRLAIAVHGDHNAKVPRFRRKAAVLRMS